jgi:hypothetical protein
MTKENTELGFFAAISPNIPQLEANYIRKTFAWRK